MIEWEVNGKIVKVSDWDKALVAASNLDRLEPEEIRGLIQGKAALLILAEYGLVFHRCAHPGEGVDVSLLVVIDQNVVYIIVSKCEEMNGVLIGEYKAEVHGEWVKKLTKKSIWDFSNIDARIEGLAFFVDMLQQSIKCHSGGDRSHCRE